ncbi:hypothetical protein AC1031_004798 [Aphanomyces cochlioides]|nr:hypothetical protein AC1031_004798 [Aphanomyces cochlioides]
MDASLAFLDGPAPSALLASSPWTLPMTFIVALSVFWAFLLPLITLKSTLPPQKPKLKRRMTSTGLTTLLTETETNQSILFTMTILDKIITREAFVEHLRPRFDSEFFVRFRSIIVGRSFVLEESFDVDDHVHFHTLAEGETAHSYAESLNNAPLDPSKPLWAVHLVHEDGKTYALWRSHHCLGDGQSMAMFFLKLCDNGHEIEAPGAAAPEAKIPLVTRLVLIAWSIALYLYKVVRTFGIPESTQFFKRPGHTKKRLAYSLNMSVDETKAVGKKLKASINDVMLSCVASALRQLVPESERSSKMFLRAGIPISMRPSSDPFVTTSNAFSSLLIDLPIGDTDGVRRTKKVVAAMRDAKFSLEKDFTLLLTKFLSLLPEAVMVPMARLMASRVSVAVTNVRGPPTEFYLAGAKIIHSLGFVPPPPSVNIGIAITSVGNTLGVTAATDKSIDASFLIRAIESEFQVLKATVMADN